GQVGAVHDRGVRGDRRASRGPGGYDPLALNDDDRVGNDAALSVEEPAEPDGGGLRRDRGRRRRRSLRQRLVQAWRGGSEREPDRGQDPGPRCAEPVERSVGHRPEWNHSGPAYAIGQFPLSWPLPKRDTPPHPWHRSKCMALPNPTDC